MTLDKAGQAYWTRTWLESPPPAPVAPEGRALAGYPDREFDRLFREVFEAPGPAPRRLLEVGCARSVWLPYFATTLGFEVTGLDYSPVGCEQARAILRERGVPGEILHGDLFSPPARLMGAFDAVFSLGLVEHFEDAAACIAALARYLRPNGRLVTIVPNLAGLVGHLQRIVNRSVYDLHVPLDREALCAAHVRAGLEGVEGRYIVPASFGICNLNGVTRGSAEWWLKKVIVAGLTRVSMGLWLVDERLTRLRLGRRTGSYVVCTARRGPALSA